MSDKKEDSSEDVITCHQCGTSNPKSNLFCSNCGNNLVDKTPCPKCGKKVMVFNSFCNYCGAPIQTTTRVKQPHSLSDESFPTTTNQQTTIRQFRPLTSEEVAAYDESRKRAQIESRNTIATILGSLLLFIGIIGIILGVLAILQLDMATLSELLPEEEIELISIYTFYATLTGMLIYPGLLMSILGGGLIWYRPDNNALKGFSKLARLIFLCISGVIIIGSTIVIIGWSFYYVSIQITGSIGFWLFVIIPIPISTNTIVLWLIILLVFLVCLASLLIRTFYDYPRIIRTFLNEKIFKRKIQETKTSEKPIFSKRTIELDEIEKKRADMPEIFHRLKNSPLTKTIELFGFSYLISFLIIFVLSPIIPTDAPPIVEDPPLISVIKVGLASITEEVSFRMILIGVPMIIVTGIKFYIQKKRGLEKNSVKQLENSSNSFTSRLFVLDEEYLAMDIPLAFLGKNKNIGIIEWILIAISGTLFGFAHWDQWTGSWAAWKIVQAGSIGIFLGYAFVKYGLASAIMIHFLNNVAIGLTNFATEQGANWIAMISGFIVMSLLSYGIMKAVSISVHYYHRSKINDEKMNQN